MDGIDRSRDSVAWRLEVDERKSWLTIGDNMFLRTE